MSKPNEESGGRTRPFADFLAEHNNGAGHALAGETLKEVALAVTDTGKKGSMTVTISVEPMKGAEGTLVTTMVVASKLPVAPPKPAVMYRDDDGNLSRSDPAQLTFDGIRDVSAGPEVRDAPAAPAVRTVGER